jgi:hypothetical protein
LDRGGDGPSPISVTAAGEFVPEFENLIIEVTGRSRGLEAGVKIGGRVHGSMAEDSPHHLVSSGIGIEVKLGRDMSEQMRVDHEPSRVADMFLDLGTQYRTYLVPAASAWKQEGVRLAHEDGSIVLDVCSEKPDGLFRKFEFYIGLASD